MKKMNIRQAFAKVKKMYPNNYISVRREYIHYSITDERTECRIYVNLPHPGHDYGLSGEGATFEEAFEELEKEVERTTNEI